MEIIEAAKIGAACLVAIAATGPASKPQTIITVSKIGITAPPQITRLSVWRA